MVETSNRSFLVRIWLEPREIVGEQVIWRGYISELASQEQRYVKNLDEITEFIKSYLDKMGVSEQ